MWEEEMQELKGKLGSRLLERQSWNINRRFTTGHTQNCLGQIAKQLQHRMTCDVILRSNAGNGIDIICFWNQFRFA